MTGHIWRVRLALALVALLALAACAPPREGGQGAADDEIVELVYQDWRTDWFPPMAQAQLAKFSEQHPNIRVYFTPDPEDVPGEMPRQFDSGTAADVISGCCDFFPAWAQAGYLLDLRPYVERDLELLTIEDWDLAQYQYFLTAEGQRYGLPKYHGALAIFYNKDLFDAQGVPYPAPGWTYEDYLTTMQRLTLDTDGDGNTDVWGSTTEPIYDRVQIHLNTFGGHYVNDQDASDCVLDSPDAVAAVEWLRARMRDDRVMATPLDIRGMQTRDAFAAGLVAMAEEGSWALKDILANADFRVGVATFPTGPAGRATLATTDGFAINAATEHPEEAWELLKFLISEEYGLAMAEANFLQPARATLIDEWAGYIRSEYPEKAEGLNLAAFADGQIQGYSVTAEVFNHMEGARTATDAAFEDILTLGRTGPVIERLQQACAEIEALQP